MLDYSESIKRVNPRYYIPYHHRYNYHHKFGVKDLSIYDHYDNFRLLLKCGDSGKFELFIHNMVEREMKSSLKYMEKMKENGVKIPIVEESLMHMIYTGFFSSVFQIIEHDIDRETAKKNVHQLKEFNTGGWERLWNIEFPV